MRILALALAALLSAPAAKPAAAEKLDPARLTATAPAVYNLVKGGFFDGARFFRVLKGFMVQFGISGDPPVNTALKNAEQ